MSLSYTDVIDATGGKDDNFSTDLSIFTKALRTARLQPLIYIYDGRFLQQP